MFVTRKFYLTKLYIRVISTHQVRTRTNLKPKSPLLILSISYKDIFSLEFFLFSVWRNFKEIDGNVKIRRNSIHFYIGLTPNLPLIWQQTLPLFGARNYCDLSPGFTLSSTRNYCDLWPEFTLSGTRISSSCLDTSNCLTNPSSSYPRM